MGGAPEDLEPRTKGPGRVGVLRLVFEGNLYLRRPEGSIPPPQGCLNPTCGAEVGGVVRGWAGSLWSLQEMV